MAKLFQRKRRNSVFISLIGILIILSACTNTDPINYSSIKGAWKCHETSLGAQRTYLVEIFKSKSGTTDYLFSNFYNVGQTGEYDINFSYENYKITFSPIENSFIRIKSGEGTVNSSFNSMTLDYIIYNGVNDIPVHAVYSR